MLPLFKEEEMDGNIRKIKGSIRRAKRLGTLVIIISLLFSQTVFAAEYQQDGDTYVEEMITESAEENAAEESNDGDAAVSEDIAEEAVASEETETEEDTVSDEAQDAGTEGTGTITFSVEDGKTRTASENCSGISISENSAGTTGLTVSRNGSYTLRGIGKNITLEIAEGLSAVDITLSGLTVNNSSVSENVPFIASGKQAKFSVTLKGSSEVKGSELYSADLIKADKGEVEFKGTGILSLNANKSAVSAKEGTISFAGGTVNVSHAGDDAVKAKDGTINLNGGTLNINNTGGDGLKAKHESKDGGGNVNITSGNLLISECYGDGIQAENVTIAGGSIDITTVSDNAATGYYTNTSSTTLNTLSESGSVKTERINVDTGSHKGIKAGTKAATKKYLDTVSVNTVEASGSLIISGGTIEIDTTGAGIKANNVSSTFGYTKTASGVYIIGSPDDGIQSNNSLYITGGDILVASGNDGIEAAGTLGITGDARVEVSEAYEGMEAARIIIGSEDSAGGPEITLNTNDDGINASSKTVVYTYDNYDDEDCNYTKVSTSKDNNSCTVYSGTVTIKIDSNNVDGNNTVTLRNGSSTETRTINYSSSGDGIDCNGSLDIEGGTVYVFGQSSGDNSPLDQDSGFTLGRGATVLATGASGMGGEGIPKSGSGVYVTTGASSGGGPGGEIPGDFPGGGTPGLPGGSGMSSVESLAAGPSGDPGAGGASSGQKFSAGNTLNITSGNTAVFQHELPYDAEFVLYASPELEKERSYTISDGSYSVSATAASPSGGGDEPGDVIKVTGIALNLANVTLKKGKSITLTAKVTPDNATDTSVSWYSSNRNVAAVSDGIVTAVGEGEATIEVRTKGATSTGIVMADSCHIIVNADGSGGTVDPAVPLTPTDSGQDGQVIPEADPSPSSDIRDVEPEANYYKAEMVKGQAWSFGKGSWESYNPNIVSVAQKTGKASAKKEGIAYLTNTYNVNAGFPVTDAYTIRVYEPVLSSKKETLLPGDTASVTLMNTGEMDVSWISSNDSVASVSGTKNAANGTSTAVIKAVGKGGAKIRAYVGGKAYTVSVTVTEQTPVRTLGRTDAIRINAFQPVALKYDSQVFKPSKAIDWSTVSGKSWTQDIKGNWTDPTQTVTITKAGKVVGNTATDDPVTAAGTDINGNEVTLEITVDAIPVKTDIYLNVGQTVTLKHSFVKGSDNIEWKYDDDCISIANADKARVKITGVSTKTASAGEAKLTCRYRDVIYTTYVHVEKPDVTVKGDLIRRNPNNYSYSLILEKGESFDIEQKLVAQNVNWKSSDKAKVFVSEAGVIYARGRGSATVSGKVNNKTVKIKVTVY